MRRLVTEAVLDASALLALLNSEPGAARVAAALPGAAMSSVNLSEVVAELADVGMPDDAIRSALESLSLEIVSFDSEQAFQSGALRPQTRALGLSLADRACLALAMRLDVPALTTDRAWLDLGIGPEVRLLR